MSLHPASPDSPSGEERIRLQKVLASSGIASRRKCEEFILAGRVTIDGETCAELGTTVDPASQIIRLDGERVTPEAKRIYLLNKPTGYVCTNSDPTGRPLAVDLVPDDRRLFSVGRLDESSEGLLLITNDGELANRLAHPRYAVSRRYQVQVAGNPDPEILKQLVRGLRFSEGYFRAKKAKKIRSQGKSSFLEIELIEGHNRELRRMLARVGHKVLQLKRVTFGPIKLGSLSPGKCRTLRAVEMKALHDMLSEHQDKPRGRKRPKLPTAAAAAARRGGSPQRGWRTTGRKRRG